MLRPLVPLSGLSPTLCLSLSPALLFSGLSTLQRPRERHLGWGQALPHPGAPWQLLLPGAHP